MIFRMMWILCLTFMMGNLAFSQENNDEVPHGPPPQQGRHRSFMKQEGPCSEFRCHEMKDRESRQSCRKERRSCMKTHMGERISKLKNEGIKPGRKKQMIEDLTLQVEKRKAQIEDLKGEIEDLEKLLTTAQSLKEKEAK